MDLSERENCLRSTNYPTHSPPLPTLHYIFYVCNFDNEMATSLHVIIDDMRLRRKDKMEGKVGMKNIFDKKVLNYFRCITK
jgi:hypothetical protein